MLIGILFSSGYSSIESKNYTGLVWNTDFPDEINQNNSVKKKIFSNDIAYIATILASPKSIAINGDGIAAGGGVTGSIYY